MSNQNETVGLPGFQGTPQNIDQVVIHVIRALCIGPMQEKNDRVFNVLRDYFSQKFQTAMFKAENPAEEARLKELFENLTKREG